MLAKADSSIFTSLRMKYSPEYFHEHEDDLAGTT